MLITPPLSQSILAQEINLEDDMKLKIIDEGILVSKSFNINNYFRPGSVYHVNEDLILPILEDIHLKVRSNSINIFDAADLQSECYGWYGVSDNIQQVLNRFKDKIEDPNNKYVITFTPVSSEEQPDKGGWRWHKWGEYIGTQNPEFEYLADEESIELIYCYHVYKLIS